jgi:hypothetical protein
MRRRRVSTASAVPVDLDALLAHVSQERVIVYRALCSTTIQRTRGIDMPGQSFSIEKGSRVVLSPRSNTVKLTPVKPGALRACPLRLAQYSVPEKYHELVGKYQHGQLILYRTWSSLYHAGVETASAGNGSSIEGFGMIERGLVLLTDALPRADLAIFEAGWNKFQRLKSLACRPGTPGEGVAASRAALVVAAKLVESTAQSAGVKL